ncbi:hypothetical protein QO010_002051 [Caulobacter ginsengisoli]|uniref:EF-hand domain-containing protein n=1 Tax=Caulobacter ginsengisoli TaxID=400775 RepID=A0ABU0IQI4_9CAUL|nr:EF-hand domain-containing protein [Caulobacter ginsengisoli]MDQ0464270.1 hypothetical protein [Caulobacter ginsengisoli]
MRRAFASVIVLIGLAAPLAAQARIPPAETIFKAWDKNKDGFITPAEWATTKRKADEFPRVDTNGDGKITLEELKVGIVKMKADQAKKLKTDQTKTP